MDSVQDETMINQESGRYALVRVPQGYEVVDTGGLDAPVVARFPLSAQGWFAARREVERLERPTAPPSSARVLISPVTHTMVVCVAMILVGVLAGAVGLFPTYLDGSSLASQASQLLPHTVYLVGWATAAVLLLRGRQMRLIAVAAVGLSAMSFGFFVTDVGSAASSVVHSAGAGLYLSLVGWTICSGASVAALVHTHSGLSKDSLSCRQRLFLPGVVVLIGMIVTFALPWDSYHLVATATAQSESFTAGNAFSNPGAVIIGELITMVAMFVVLALAFAWRPMVTGTALLIGALVPLIGQLFSALMQPAPSLVDFGVSQATAIQDQVHLSAGYTPWFYLYCSGIGLLVVAGGWMIARVTSQRS